MNNTATEPRAWGAGTVTALFLWVPSRSRDARQLGSSFKALLQGGAHPHPHCSAGSGSAPRLVP